MRDAHRFRAAVRTQLMVNRHCDNMRFGAGRFPTEQSLMLNYQLKESCRVWAPGDRNGCGLKVSTWGLGTL